MVTRSREVEVGPLLLQAWSPTQKVYTYDLRALMHIRGATLSPTQSVLDSARHQAGPLIKSRLKLVSVIHGLLIEERALGNSDRTLNSRFMALRRMWKYCDEHAVSIGDFDLQVTRNALSIWVEKLWQDIRVGKLREMSAANYVLSVSTLLAQALNVTMAELLARIALPSKKKCQPPSHDKLDMMQVDRFCMAMSDICTSLSLEAIRDDWPIVISFRGGERAVWYGQGQRPRKNIFAMGPEAVEKFVRKYADTRSEASTRKRKSLLNIRSQAECLRFISVTGMNLQTALDICPADIHFKSFVDQYHVTGFKNRRGSAVEFRIPKSYRSSFVEWMKFRSIAFAEIGAERLFPIFGRDNIESPSEGERGFRPIANILLEANLPRIPPSLLRFAKVQRLLRLAAVGGDIQKSAGELQHGLPTLLRSYLRGSQQMSMAEIGKFVASIRPTQQMEHLRDGGGCAAPNKPRKIEVMSASTPEPDCGNPAGCLFCSQYRAIESEEYLHSILSYREFLRLRAGASPLETRTWEAVIRPTMQRIDDISINIGARSDALSTALSLAKQKIDIGDFHPRWLGWIEMLYA